MARVEKDVSRSEGSKEVREWRCQLLGLQLGKDLPFSGEKVLNPPLQDDSHQKEDDNV